MRMMPSVSMIHSRQWGRPSAKCARIGTGITDCPGAVYLTKSKLPNLRNARERSLKTGNAHKSATRAVVREFADVMACAFLFK